MEHSFWHARWRQGRIGFHEAATNRHLLSHWSALKVPEGSRVLVPLCGKSLDMLHLRSLGHEVVGVELSPMACEAFYVENELSFQTRVRGAFMAFEGSGPAAGITLLCGDFTLLRAEEFGSFDAFYDRASIIALPPKMRDRHVHAIAENTKRGGVGLVTTISYPRDEKDGPPFSVPPDEVHHRFMDHFGVRELGSTDAGEEGAIKWGLSWLKEHQFAMTKR